MKAESISKVLTSVEVGKPIGWFTTSNGSLICWKQNSGTGEITVYECVGGTLKGSKLNSPIKLDA